ncbi:cyclic GMP-AMP synthase-like receptor 1 [Oculina patagonica]
METLTSHSTKKQRGKVISTKVQPRHKPRRPHFQTAGRTGHKTGKDVITEIKLAIEPRKKTVHFQERSLKVQPLQRPKRTVSRTDHTEAGKGVITDIKLTTEPGKKTFRFQERIPDHEKSGKHWNLSTGQPNSEIRPQRSRPVAQDATVLKKPLAGGPYSSTQETVARGIRRLRSGVSREQTSLPVKSQHSSSRGGAARGSHRKVEPRNMVPEPCCSRPTRERHLTSAAPPERPVQILRQALPTDLNSLRAPLLKFFKEKVSLSQEDISRTSDAVKSLLSTILDKIRKKDDTFALKPLNTGSYYEKLKVSHPVEFDVMLVFDAHRIMRFFDEQYSRDHPGYAKLVFKDFVHGGRELWGQFLTRDGKYLSPGELVGRFYKLVCDAVKAMSGCVSQPILNGPAVTLTIDRKIDVDLVLSVEVKKWPRCASGWGDFATNRTWPTRCDVEQIKMKEPKFHLVAKSFPDTRGVCTDSHLYWRISFSNAEKTLLKSASTDKKYYRITKAICLAKKRELEPLTSFHLKNLFLHNRSQYPRARHDDNNLGESVVKFFESLIDRLEQGSLPHFFVPRANLFVEMSRGDRMNVAGKLRRYLGELVQNPNRFLENLHL